MKTIELTPEWVLENLQCGCYADGNGIACVHTENVTNASFIELALKTLEIQFEQHDSFDSNDALCISFYFRIEDIRNDCPTFYEDMREMDIVNRGLNFSKN